MSYLVRCGRRVGLEGTGASRRTRVAKKGCTPFVNRPECVAWYSVFPDNPRALRARQFSSAGPKSLLIQLVFGSGCRSPQHDPFHRRPRVATKRRRCPQRRHRRRFFPAGVGRPPVRRVTRRGRLVILRSACRPDRTAFAADASIFAIRSCVIDTSFDAKRSRLSNCHGTIADRPNDVGCIPPSATPGLLALGCGAAVERNIGPKRPNSALRALAFSLWRGWYGHQQKSASEMPSDDI
jgi:hypothetical protein